MRCCCAARTTSSGAARAARPVPKGELEDLAVQAADDALAAVLAKLDTFRGASRFTTWAYKFVLLEAGVKARRRAWQDREVALEEDSWRRLADRAPGVQQTVEEAELLRAIAGAVGSALTPHQRVVFTALALDGVPIDVLAERLASTRGALYKTLHDARRKLRTTLADAGYRPHWRWDVTTEHPHRDLIARLLGPGRARGQLRGVLRAPRPVRRPRARRRGRRCPAARDARALRGLPRVPRGSREPARARRRRRNATRLDRLNRMIPPHLSGGFDGSPTWRNRARLRG